MILQHKINAICHLIREANVKLEIENSSAPPTMMAGHRSCDESSSNVCNNAFKGIHKYRFI